MKYTWIKKGLIFKPSKNSKQLKTHAALPIADNLKNNHFKIYFSARNSNNIASIFYLNWDISKPKQVSKISSKPILSSGKLGSFDEFGVMAHSILENNGLKYLYYTGWSRSSNTPFRWAIGLAISKDGGKSFQKFSEGPILDRNVIDPYFVASPTVIKEKKLWKMWYVSGLGWQIRKGKIFSPYHIRYAESKDGINWERNGIVSINFKNKSETRIGRASIQKNKGKYLMWYSYASKSYRIGFAESNDGIKWRRKDNCVGISTSEKGWDSQMIEYPYVFLHNGTTYMLYNGNNYGKTGFGLAVLKP